MLQLTVCLDSGGEKPLYQQLYESLASQIRSGALKPGDRLPGKRSLAGQLAVAVNTVDTAYQMLAAEGYGGPAGPPARRRGFPAGQGG